MDTPQPNHWRCPNPDCQKVHSRPHWPDHHQKEPGWLEKLGDHDFEKGSNEEFKTVCELCGEQLRQKPTKRKLSFESLQKKPKDWCETCNAKRTGIPAPLFCPHCGYTQERVLLLKTS